MGLRNLLCSMFNLVKREDADAETKNTIKTALLTRWQVNEQVSNTIREEIVWLNGISKSVYDKLVKDYEKHPVHINIVIFFKGQLLVGKLKLNAKNIGSLSSNFLRANLVKWESHTNDEIKRLVLGDKPEKVIKETKFETITFAYQNLSCDTLFEFKSVLWNMHYAVDSKAKYI